MTVIIQMLNRTLDNNRGISIVPIIVVIVIVVTASSAIAMLSINALQLSKNDRKYSASYYTAESGLTIVQVELEELAKQAREKTQDLEDAAYSSWLSDVDDNGNTKGSFHFDFEATYVQEVKSKLTSAVPYYGRNTNLTIGKTQGQDTIAQVSIVPVLGNTYRITSIGIPANTPVTLTQEFEIQYFGLYYKSYSTKRKDSFIHDESATFNPPEKNVYVERYLIGYPTTSKLDPVIVSSDYFDYQASDISQDNVAETFDVFYSRGISQPYSFSEIDIIPNNYEVSSAVRVNNLPPGVINITNTSQSVVNILMPVSAYTGQKIIVNGDYQVNIALENTTGTMVEINPDIYHTSGKNEKVKLILGKDINLEKGSTINSDLVLSEPQLTISDITVKGNLEVLSFYNTDSLTINGLSKVTGTLYMPSTNLEVGGYLEVGRSIVARSLELEPGVNIITGQSKKHPVWNITTEKELSKYVGVKDQYLTFGKIIQK